MMTNIIAALLAAATILCLAVFHVSQKNKKANFREEIINRYRGQKENDTEEVGR